MVEASTEMDSGQKRLHELGYKQELRRTLSSISNFALCFSALCLLMGVTALYNTGLTYGGTISFTWGWLICGSFDILVAAAMAEICSAFPTSGGLYFWSAQLASPKWKPFAAWLTGCQVSSEVTTNHAMQCMFNVIRGWAGLCSVAFALAQLLQVLVLLGTGGANGGGYLLNKYQLLGLHAAILLCAGLVNCMPIQALHHLSLFAAAWNLAGTAVLIVLIPAVATERQSASFVFTSFHVPSDLHLPDRSYIFLLGLLVSQYSMVGFDASAHMTEETKASGRNGAIGIVSCLVMTFIAGYAYILGLSFVVMDPDFLLYPGNDAAGYAIGQLFFQVFKDRYGSGTGGVLCLGVVAVAMFLCCTTNLTSASRMVYAFSRDEAMPLSNLWHKLNSHEVPLNALWLTVFMAFVIAIPSLGSLVAFQAMASIATIGLYIAYAIPIFLRVTHAHRSFVQGPVNLGPRWASLTIGWVSILWVCTTTILFCLPVRFPQTSQTLNYTPVAVVGVFLLVGSYWLFSACTWFKGPQRNYI